MMLVARKFLLHRIEIGEFLVIYFSFSIADFSALIVEYIIRPCVSASRALESERKKENDQKEMEERVESCIQSKFLTRSNMNVFTNDRLIAPM